MILRFLLLAMCTDFSFAKNQSDINNLQNEKRTKKNIITKNTTTSNTTMHTREILKIISVKLLNISVQILTTGIVMLMARQIFMNLGSKTNNQVYGTRMFIDSAAYLTLTLNDVIGMKETIHACNRFIDTWKNPDIYRQHNITTFKAAILFAGSPGNGKTMLIEAMAKELGLPFFRTFGSDFQGSLIGSSARNIEELFRAAASVKKAIIFIDEIDVILASRGNPHANQEEVRATTQFFALLDSVNRHNQQPDNLILVFGATNRINALDEASNRRFSHVTVCNPTYSDRIELLQDFLHKIPHYDKTIDLEHFATHTEGFSRANLKQMIDTAVFKMLERKQMQNILTQEDIEYGLQKMQEERKMSKMDHLNTNNNTKQTTNINSFIEQFLQPRTNA